MTGLVKRALTGRLTRGEKQKAALLGLSGLLLTQLVSPAFLFLPLFILCLAFHWWLVTGVALVAFLSPLKLGPAGLIVALVCGVLVEAFRHVYEKEHRVARERQELLKTLVHELRNPLFAAKGTIDNLATRFHELEPQDMEVQLAMASNAMQSINQEVDDLTQLLRLESGRLAAHPETMCLESVFQTLSRRFPPHSIPNHQLIMTGGEIEAVCDSLLLLQALDKLVGNAIVHSERGVVSVTATGGPGGVSIEVLDQGPGIPPEERHGVFERFKQLGPNSIGFGLGLFLARQYVLAQRGELTLEKSETGCRFRIWLPRCTDEDQSSHC